MAHIALPPELPPGTLGLAQYRPETGRPLTELVEALLHAPGDLGRADRALIAAYVSVLNDSRFCASTTTEVCAQLLPEGRPLVDKILADPASAPISSKLRALLAIAKAVRDSGHAVTGEVVGAARRAGATDVEIHDAVLIAAVFSMLNRYNDGLAAEQRRDAPACRPAAGGPPSPRRAPEETAEAERLAEAAGTLAEEAGRTSPTSTSRTAGRGRPNCGARPSPAPSAG
ncbi:carboxymuconolactone decarboxylase family protein [Actinomadura yumaensis]|uniref:carboxymuconolactone decarboxylase family protein n=1 Tax=Actinomadura yumaensis TaxID=111807 RepID=UPI00361366A2